MTTFAPQTTNRNMPPRGDKPGFKIGRNGRRYWIASQARRSGTFDFPDRCIELPADLVTAEQIAEFCRFHTARLDAWIERRKQAIADPTLARTRYDGTVRSGCRIFQQHPLSPFNLRMKHNTQRTCVSFLKLIEQTAGDMLFRHVTVPLVMAWYEDWRAPDFPGDREHIKRAHEAVSTFRQVVYFLASMRRYDGCKQLADELQYARFDKPGARTQEITYAQVVAFCRAADEMAAKGAIPATRARNMKIGVVAQFETLLRQRDIIGEWAAADARRWLPSGIATLAHQDEVWAGYFTWENVHGWRWVMKTSKSRFRKVGDFRLDKLGLLFPLLEAVPLAERTGAIVKGEHDLPVRARSYGKWFRQIARWAGIPDEVWNMDTRAGGASEADAAGVDFAALQRALTHTSPAMTARYIRGDVARKIEAVAEARRRRRSEGGTS